MFFKITIKQQSTPPYQAIEEFSKLLVILNHLLGQPPPVNAIATHQSLLHQSSDILHHDQPLGLLLQTL